MLGTGVAQGVKLAKRAEGGGEEVGALLTRSTRGDESVAGLGVRETACDGRRVGMRAEAVREHDGRLDRLGGAPADRNCLHNKAVGKSGAVHDNPTYQGDELWGEVLIFPVFQRAADVEHRLVHARVARK